MKDRNGTIAVFVNLVSRELFDATSEYGHSGYCRGLERLNNTSRTIRTADRFGGDWIRTGGLFAG